MPTIDMSLKELQEYKGINPKPADFDEYWERALAEMNALDPEVEITPAKFISPNVDCFDMYFTGTGGARVYAKLLKPKSKGKCPAVLHFHGYSGASAQWSYYLNYAAAGFIVAALDCRGQAGKSEDVGGVSGNTLNGHIIRGLDGPADNMLFRHIFLDTALLAKIVMAFPETDENRVCAWGGSQGGALTVACAALTPKLKLAEPCFPFLSDYKRVWDMDMDLRAYAELREHFRHFDPRHEHEDEIFEKLGYIDLHNLAPRIKARIKMFTGLMDDVCPASTQFAIYNNLTCEKEVVIYPDFGHEGLPDNEDMVYEDFITLL